MSDVPHADGVVACARRPESAVRVECHATSAGGVFEGVMEALAGGQAPEAHPPIAAARCERLSFEIDRHASDRPHIIVEQRFFDDPTRAGEPLHEAFLVGVAVAVAAVP